MTTKDDRNIFERFVDDIGEGYRKQDEAIKKEQASMNTGERIAEGAINGVTDALLSPVRWLRSLFS